MHKNDPYELKTESQVTNYAAINLAEGFQNYPSQHSGSRLNSQQSGVKIPKLNLSAA